MENKQETLYHVKNGYMVQNIADNYVLMAPAVNDIDYSQMMILSESAALIINHLIKESLNFDSLVKLLLNEYDVEEELVVKELKELIVELQKLNVLES